MGNTTAEQPTDSVVVSAATLPELGRVASVPAYDRSALRRSIVHVGVGGFHRAHLATYIDELATAGSVDWSIVGVGVLDGDVAIAEALGAQDHLYTLISKGADTTDVQVIGSIVDFVFAAHDSTPFLDRVADADTQIVSLTITEGGYPVDDVTGDFIASKCSAGSVFDLLARGLDARRTGCGLPITVLSCDNIMTNGEVARTATLGAAAAISADLAAWIEANASFPNSMVDRITPVTTPDDIAALEHTTGIVDRWPVVAEPFRQWVVEDHFAGDRLPLESMDVIVTADIEPYELTKLRLLNAGHSCLAYLAALDGHRTVDTAMADPVLGRFVETLLHVEAKSTLPAAAGIDLDDYIATLIVRFSNPEVGDQIARLCLDGTAKFPKFLIPTVAAQVAGDGHVELSALALAGWCEYLAGERSGLSSDPLLDEAIAFARRSIDDPGAFLQFDAVFGRELADTPTFVSAFASALSAIRGAGVQSAVAAALDRSDERHERHPD